MISDSFVDVAAYVQYFGPVHLVIELGSSLLLLHVPSSCFDIVMYRGGTTQSPGAAGQRCLTPLQLHARSIR